LTHVTNFKEHDMRVPVFPIIASLALLAAPAFAQNAPMTGTNGDQNGTPGYISNGMTGNGSGYNGTGAYNGGGYNGMTGAYNNQGARNSWTKSAGVTSDTRERIRQSLMQSGFRDVTVTPQAFVIRAMAPDGSHIVMLLRPDELAGVIESGSSSGGNRNYSNSGWNGGASTNNGGDNDGGAANR
jgi:hypothetical protein